MELLAPRRKLLRFCSRRYWTYRVLPAVVLGGVLITFISMMYIGGVHIEEQVKNQIILQAIMSATQTTRIFTESLTSDHEEHNVTDKHALEPIELKMHVMEAPINRQLDMSQVCPGKNFAFINCLKCYSQPMDVILRKFALQHKVSVILPIEDNVDLGWPYSMQAIDFRLSNSRHGIGFYDCLIERAVFDLRVLKSTLPIGSKYITMIREPFEHFKSLFLHFEFAKMVKEEWEEPVYTFIRDIKKIDDQFKSPEYAPKRPCIPDGFTVTRNTVLHTMGFPTAFPDKYKDITMSPRLFREYMEFMDNEFSLVMISEYFHESLILLRRLMCWSLKDILYRKVEPEIFNYTVTGFDSIIYERWNNAEFKFFSYFNKTFWERIKYQGESFPREVEVFGRIQNRVSAFCGFPHDLETTLETNSSSISVVAGRRNITVLPTKFSTEFTVTKRDCSLLKGQLLPALKDEYERNLGWARGHPPKTYDGPKRGC